MNRSQIGAIVVMAGGVLLLVGGVVGLLNSASVEAAPTAAATSTTTATVETSTTLSTIATGETTTTSPSTTTSTPTTTSTSIATSTTGTVLAETPEDFLVVLVQGLRGDPELLVSRLNQVTLDIYGADQCLETLGQVLDPETEIEVREIGEPGPWDYVIDDITTPLNNVLPIEVERFVAGQTIIQELHWQLVEGQWTFFTDCGDPL